MPKYFFFKRKWRNRRTQEKRRVNWGTGISAPESGTTRQKNKKVHPPIFLAMAISPLSLFLKKYFGIVFLKSNYNPCFHIQFHYYK
jgi:hypothetical protein